MKEMEEEKASKTREEQMNVLEKALEKSLKKGEEEGTEEREKKEEEESTEGEREETHTIPMRWVKKHSLANLLAEELSDDQVRSLVHGL